jgi:hypothetical protein
VKSSMSETQEHRWKWTPSRKLKIVVETLPSDGKVTELSVSRAHVWKLATSGRLASPLAGAAAEAIAPTGPLESNPFTLTLTPMECDTVRSASDPGAPGLTFLAPILRKIVNPSFCGPAAPSATPTFDTLRQNCS